MTRWQPCLELTRLLEALGEEIVAATDREVGQMHGRTIESTAREVRLFISAAQADKDESLREALGESLSESATGLHPTKISRRSPHQHRH